MPVISRTQNAIAAFKRGEIVIVTDDDDRENEGDLIVAASLCTPEKMAFIIRHTSGIVCAPLKAEAARRLDLAPMVAQNNAPLATAFTVSVDARHGLTTGISAEERTNTVRALANGNMGAGDFVRPGHVFPLIAREGGVLMRSGHTEAAVDLCDLAELPPVGVIGELMNDDGTVMRGEAIIAFAQKHQLTTLSVADLIAYRQAREKLVHRAASFLVQTEIGALQGHAYTTPFDSANHLALIYGTLPQDAPTVARFHRGDVLVDVFGGGQAIRATLEIFKRHGHGVLVYLRDGAAGVPASALNIVESHGAGLARDKQWREVGLGAQILRDLDIDKIKLISRNQRKYVGLAGFGIEIAETIEL